MEYEKSRKCCKYGHIYNLVKEEVCDMDRGYPSLPYIVYKDYGCPKCYKERLNRYKKWIARCEKCAHREVCIHRKFADIPNVNDNKTYAVPCEDYIDKSLLIVAKRF